MNDMGDLESVLTERCPGLDGSQLAGFRSFYELLVKWNEFMNLTAITGERDVAVRHFHDSLTLVPYLRKYSVKSLADVGTGAGFPGIPLAIALPDIKITLIDSLEKRVNFLNTVIEELKLGNVSAVHARAEDAGRNPLYRGKFDCSVARAVAPMNILCEYCIPFIKKGGIFAAMKGPQEENCESALKALGSVKISEDIISLPAENPDGEDYTRRIIIIENRENISGKYPRKAGIPKKSPL